MTKNVKSPYLHMIPQVSAFVAAAFALFRILFAEQVLLCPIFHSKQASPEAVVLYILHLSRRCVRQYAVLNYLSIRCKVCRRNTSKYIHNYPTVSVPSTAALTRPSTSILLSDSFILSSFGFKSGFLGTNIVQQSSYGRIDVSYVPIFLA